MNETETKSKKKDTSKISIYLKLHLIQTEIKELIRTEENKFQKYKFFNELQVLNLLKPLLQKHKLTILFSDEENKEFSCEQQGNMYLVKYQKKCLLINSEEPSEQLIHYFWAIGQNNDPAKAKGSAETYALKYFLSKLFLIPVKDEMDPDYSPREEVVSKPTQKTITLNQVDSLMNFLVQKRGNSKEIQTNFLKEVDKLMPKYRIVGETAPGNLRGRVSLLKDEDYQTLWNWLEKLPDSK